VVCIGAVGLTVSTLEPEKTDESERVRAEAGEERRVAGVDCDWEGGLAGKESVLPEAVSTVAEEEAASGSLWAPVSESGRGDGRRLVGTELVSEAEAESTKDERVD
jgi:hypothetical protein